MKAPKKIALLEQALDNVLSRMMIVAKNDESLARAYDNCGVAPLSIEAEAMIFESGKRIANKVR